MVKQKQKRFNHQIDTIWYTSIRNIVVIIVNLFPDKYAKSCLAYRSMRPLVLTNSNSLPKNHPSMMPGKRNADCSDFVPQATWVYQLEDIWVVTARQHLNTWFWSQSVVVSYVKIQQKWGNCLEMCTRFGFPRDVWWIFSGWIFEGLLRICFFAGMTARGFMKG